MKDRLMAPDLASNARAMESPHAVHTAGTGVRPEKSEESEKTNMRARSLTDALMKFHSYDGSLVVLVLPGTVAELCDPALGRAVRRAAVHQPGVEEVQARQGRGGLWLADPTCSLPGWR